MLLSSDFDTDPRVTKEARTLRAAGFDVSVCWWDRKRIKQGNVLSVMLGLPRFYLKCVRQAKQEWPFVAVHCNDWDTMIPGIIIKWTHRIPLVYDLHDLFEGYFLNPVARWIVGTIDRFFRWVCDRQIVVDSVYVNLPGFYPEKTVVVMNCPESRKTELLADDGSLFYAGGLILMRDIRYLLPWLSQSDLPVYIAGSGPMEESYRALADNGVQILGRISLKEVERRTEQCHAVMALYDPRYRLNKMASPNKCFDAMMCGKPSIVSKGTRIAEIVEEENCGVTVEYGDVDDFARAVKRLCDPHEYERMSVNGIVAFARMYNWDIMGERLVEMYRDLT